MARKKAKYITTYDLLGAITAHRIWDFLFKQKGAEYTVSCLFEIPVVHRKLETRQRFLIVPVFFGGESSFQMSHVQAPK